MSSKRRTAVSRDARDTASVLRRVAVLLIASALLVALPLARSVTPSAEATSGVTTTTVCSNASVLATWSLTSLANQTIVVPVNATSIASATPIALGGYGGIILFGATGSTTIASVISTLQAQTYGHRGLLIMTDNEGGGVWRLANLLSPLPWARTMGSTMSSARITAAATQAGLAMRRLGITMDLAPVLDIDGTNAPPSASNPDGYRSFGGNAKIVTSAGVAFMKGLLAAHVVPVIKHFPGLGGTSPNTDDGSAATASWTTVQETSLGPFVAAIAAGAPAIMIGNASIPGVTSLPAGVSSAVLQGIVRQQLGFKGLIMTDSLSAGAVSAAHLSVTAAATAAVEAGADSILFGFPHSGTAVQQASAISASLVNAVNSGHLSRATLTAAATQVLQAKGVNLCTATG